ncbi:alpha/beta hydrolase [Streptomyces sp. YC504]|uniref:Alpha/beta hydrolase n=1 Tax=Streptomyces mesophilus TaxID=1775132 RepID=A0A6G4XKR5_9ACTN|nr:alpha/beta hydrolase [Streptomyces mesophilus]NGO77417.1 alpha/beta hydrolase [Streptomyces mesophilus]
MTTKGDIRGIAALALAAVAVFVLPGPVPAAAATAPDLTRFYGQRIAWTDCGDEMEYQARRTWAGSDEKLPAAMSRFECGDVEVPRDYADPKGKAGTAQIAALRLKATDQKRRIGSLVLNFGGPGLSGRYALNSHIPQLARLNERFDLVAHDPRGVVRSDPVLCDGPQDGDPAEEPAQDPGQGPARDQTPDTADEVTRVAEAQAAKNAQCDQASARRVLPWVGTTNSSRDLDVLRAALGDDKLHYLGFSYGTKLGAAYLHQFPDRAGRMVLDGVMDPTLDTRADALSSTKAFQRALDNFLADCVAHGAKECPLGATAAAAKSKVNALFTGLDGKPLETSAGTLDQATFTQAVQSALYSKAQHWPQLRTALAELASKGNGTAMAEAGGKLPSAQLPRGPFPAVTSDEDAQQQEFALRAINCRDASERPTAEDYLAAVDEFTALSPVFGHNTAAAMLECTGWPVPGDNTSREVGAEDAPSSLLVGTRGDPATPYENTARMAAALDNDSRILTYEGEGHGAYTTDSTCIHEHVDRYLTEGTLPPEDTTCR